MTLDMQIAILTTVNAPYQNHLDASALADALNQGEYGLGQVSSFLTEVNVDAQQAFANQFGIPIDHLMEVATSFSNWSGQVVALVA